ncbi:deoxyribose-phosphate aldolase [Gelidibacter salicanalis]|uniref:Deoxyribose-phosphate aldolase n=2 Tax=Gelidibacter salicanalis TaxID=291193 RepID=A0A934KU79_9FLAO|nr:deoxyribose-phosphate aldolase [Gelidibacter salicanalis]
MTLLTCKQDNKEVVATESAKEIIQQSILAAGGNVFDYSNINFDFRDIHYKAHRDGGKFQLERYIKDSVSDIRDVLNNSGFERFQSDVKVELSDSLVALYSASVNSVHYFSVLPYGLDGSAVYKDYLGTEEIEGKSYHKIKVTFSEDGGGEDFEDEFLYWIDQVSYDVDYLAYSYEEIDGMGYRFREAYNVRMVNGLRFADYNNYKPTTSDFNFEDLGLMFNKDKLELLSKIELQNIEVESLN